MPAKIAIPTTPVATSTLKKKLKKLGDGASLLPHHVFVPVPPTYDPTKGVEERAQYDEQQTARVELLMAKGIRAKPQLMALLDVKDGRQMERYITRVFARWEMFGTSRQHARHRGEGLVRLDLIESELWSRLGNFKDPRAEITILATILNVHKERVTLQGLTQKVLERIGFDTSNQVSFAKAAADHDKVSRIAARMLELIGERSDRVIEHVPSNEQASAPDA